MIMAGPQANRVTILQADLVQIRLESQLNTHMVSLGYLEQPLTQELMLIHCLVIIILEHQAMSRL
jgi:hypothetical protein